MRNIAVTSIVLVSLIASAGRAAPDVSSSVRVDASRVGGTIGVYVRTLGHVRPVVALNASESFPSASVIKVLIMATAFDAAEGSPRYLDRLATIHSWDLVGGSEFLANAGAGDRFPLRVLIEHMITQSDNTAANALISYFGFARINAEAQKIGMHNTHLKRHFLDWAAIVKHNENVTTAADMGLLLYQIERGAHEGIMTIAQPADCRKMIGFMLGQEDREKIPAGLPPGVSVANKTGEITGVRSDVAIVDPFGENPYVITVLSKDLDDYASGINAIRAISRDVFNAIGS